MRRHDLFFDLDDVDRFLATLKKTEKLPQKIVTSSVNKGTTVVRRTVLGGVPVDTGALKRGIVRHAEKTKIKGKKVNDLMFDPAMNNIFQKHIKNPGEAGGKRPTGYYPASMEYGFLTRSKGGGYSYVPGYHFMRIAAENSHEPFNRTVIKDAADKLEKEWLKKHAT